MKLETETIVLVDLVSAAAACKLENCNLFMCLPVLVTLFEDPSSGSGSVYKKEAICCHMELFQISEIV